RELNPLDRYKRFQIIHPPFLDLAWRKGSFILHLPLLHITRSPHWRGRAASVPQWPSVFLGCAFVARKAVLKGLTLDHFTNDRLHVCLCKRSQRLRANISKGATAQSKRGHGNVIWCLNNRDHLVLAQCPEGVPHGRSALLRHFSEGVRPFR